MRLTQVLALVALFISAFMLGFSSHMLIEEAFAGQFEREAFADVSDKMMPPVEVQALSGDSSDEETEEAPEVPEEEEAPVLEDEGVPYVDSGQAYETSYCPTDGLTREGGVNYHEGRRETWYSSTTLYHKDTGDWTLDDEGFYRDSDGYYVVAASDMEQGETFEGSKGDCKVYDTGCPAGTTDYYVNASEMR